MTQSPNVTIARTLDCTEINVGKGFAFSRVFDLRCEAGQARPIEEVVLKRLSNHFVDYEQIPLEFSVDGPCKEVHICESVKASDKNTLVLADDLSQIAALFQIYNIEFTSRSFYVVETGKGEIVRPIPAEHQEVAQAASFGTFGA